MKLIGNLRAVCNSGIYLMYLLPVLLNACVDSQFRIGEMLLICQQAIVSVFLWILSNSGYDFFQQRRKET
jgi:hypothetical protein